MLYLRRVHQRARRGGFTLVELLIVFAVLATLLALLMPLFQSTRQVAFRVKCSSNLRQLGTAFTLYARDWDGYWPCPGGLVGDRSYWSQTGNGGLWPYVRQRGVNSVWCCPLMEDWRSRYPARTYGMNSYLRTPADVEYYDCVGFLRGIDTAVISEPRRTILLYEGLALTTGWENSSLHNYIYRCANWQYVRGFPSKFNYVQDPQRPWHGRVNNYLYCDGHLIARPPGRKTTGTYSSYAEMREWYVDKRRFAVKYARVTL